MSNKNVYTDLAVEAHNMAVERTGEEVKGVSLEENQTENTEITRVTVLNQQGAKSIGKPVGTYITIESRGLQGQNRKVHDELSEVLSRELEGIINFNELKTKSQQEPTIFVVGLGNWNATPDALGPQVLNSLMVTRHLYNQAPPEVRNGMRPVCALAPGVLGLTGIQTAEIIKGVVDTAKPDLIVAVDALAARNTDRLGKTIQLSNTGIAPGSGVGKNRMGINNESMQIPVIAVGVPTVVGAVTIVNDAMDRLMDSEMFSKTERERFTRR
jgi:spore protease